MQRINFRIARSARARLVSALVCLVVAGATAAAIIGVTGGLTRSENASNSSSASSVTPLFSETSTSDPCDEDPSFCDGGGGGGGGGDGSTTSPPPGGGNNTCKNDDAPLQTSITGYGPTVSIAPHIKWCWNGESFTYIAKTASLGVPVIADMYITFSINDPSPTFEPATGTAADYYGHYHAEVKFHNANYAGPAADCTAVIDRDYLVGGGLDIHDKTCS